MSKPKIDPIKAHFASIGRLGGAVRGACKARLGNTGALGNLSAQMAALIEAIDNGRRPLLGPRLAEHAAENAPKSYRKAIAECPRGPRTVWTITKRAAEIEEERESAAKTRKAKAST